MSVAARVFLSESAFVSDDGDGGGCGGGGNHARAAHDKWLGA